MQDYLQCALALIKKQSNLDLKVFASVDEAIFVSDREVRIISNIEDK